MYMEVISLAVIVRIEKNRPFNAQTDYTGFHLLLFRSKVRYGKDGLERILNTAVSVWEALLLIPLTVRTVESGAHLIQVSVIFLYVIFSGGIVVLSNFSIATTSWARSQIAHSSYCTSTTHQEPHSWKLAWPSIFFVIKLGVPLSRVFSSSSEATLSGLSKLHNHILPRFGALWSCLIFYTGLKKLFILEKLHLEGSQNLVSDDKGCHSNTDACVNFNWEIRTWLAH